MARYNKILAALDGGDTQLAVARRALSIAHDNHADVLFAHALESAELEVARVNIDDYVNKSMTAIENNLERQLFRAIHDDCVASVKVLVQPGRINDTLGQIAKDFKPDLVICGVRGLSNIKYAFVGSVSTYLIRHMECDVLVVRPEAIEDIDEDDYAAAQS